eukprot:gene33218-42955_t
MIGRRKIETPSMPVDNAIFKNSVVAGSDNNNMQEELEFLIHREFDRRLTASLETVDKRFVATQELMTGSRADGNS